jgi:hypothetical protein
MGFGKSMIYNDVDLTFYESINITISFPAYPSKY